MVWPLGTLRSLAYLALVKIFKNMHRRKEMDDINCIPNKNARKHI
jgi:hypothetical protein